MVLQRDAPIPVWGWADPGSEITVSFSGMTASTTSAADGTWRLRLPPVSCPAGNVPQSLVVKSGAGTHAVVNILIGDVWVCAGQSNMAFQLHRATTGREAAAKAADPLIRICDVVGKRSGPGDVTLDDLEAAPWKVASPESVRNFSAVGYFFGKDLRKSIGVPVGLIDTSVGGTSMKCWMSRETMATDPLLKDEVERHDNDMKNLPKLLEQYERRLASYQKRLAEGNPPGHKPIQPKGPDSSYRLSYLHASVIRPLQPFAIKGVIWYQGEANAGRHAVFAHQFSTLVAEWRREWGQGDFPWLFVQLAPYSETVGKYFPHVWEAQEKSQNIPNSAMVVALDHGVANDIHPPHKQPVGERLAIAAKTLVYRQQVDWRGPVFKAAIRRDNTLLLQFDNIGDGLMTKEPEMGFFSIAGADGKFLPATARLSADNTVAVSHPDLTNPSSVRYGWYGVGEPVGASLFGKNGLPVAPFRSDNPAAPR